MRRRALVSWIISEPEGWRDVGVELGGLIGGGGGRWESSRMSDIVVGGGVTLRCGKREEKELGEWRWMRWRTILQGEKS